MSTLLCSLFTSIHTEIISTLYILTLLLAPVKTLDRRVWRAAVELEYVDCEQKFNIFWIFCRYSSLQSRTHIRLESKSGYLGRGGRRHHHRELREGQLAVTVRVRRGEHLLHLQLDIQILIFQIIRYFMKNIFYIIQSTCQSYTGTGRCFITWRNSDCNIQILSTIDILYLSIVSC